MRNDLWTIDKTLIERLRAHTCTYECVRLWMYEDVSTGTLTATLPLIWTTGRGESRKRFDDFDGLVRTADWLPPTSRQTFDEIQTFGPIPLAGCGNRGPRNGVVYSTTTVNALWIPEDGRSKCEIGKLDNWRARWSDKRPWVLHAKQIGPRWSIEHYRISRSRQFYDQRSRIYIHDSHGEFLEKILVIEVMSDQRIYTHS